MSVENIIIIGSGPAAHTAAIYCARAELKPLMFEGFMAGGIAAGGQLTTTTHIENFPAFPDGISGVELMQRMRQHSLNSGVRIFTETVEKVDFSTKPFKIFATQTQSQAHAVIIATGAIAKRLRLPSEDKFWQHGISACAVCDGALPIYRNVPVAVVGGGDVAMEEALYLTKFASQVYVIHRRDQLRASAIMAKRAMTHNKIKFIWNTVVLDAYGEQNLNSIKIKNLKTNEESLLAVNGLFYAIGHIPNTAFLGGQLNLDENGYILTRDNWSTKTSVLGVFACGDVIDKKYRQAIVAAGTGCMAALEVKTYLDSLAL